MRDINRISRVMSLLEIIWEAHPDLRFNQLLDSIQRSYVNEESKTSIKFYYNKEEFNGNEYYVPTAVLDLFYLEDDKFEIYLKKLVDKLINQSIDKSKK